MTLITRNQIIYVGLHSAIQNMVVRGIGQHLKSLAGFDDGGMSADSSDCVPDLRRRVIIKMADLGEFLEAEPMEATKN